MGIAGAPPIYAPFPQDIDTAVCFGTSADLASGYNLP